MRARELSCPMQIGVSSTITSSEESSSASEVVKSIMGASFPFPFPLPEPLANGAKPELDDKGGASRGVDRPCAALRAAETAADWRR